MTQEALGGIMNNCLHTFDVVRGNQQRQSRLRCKMITNDSLNRRQLAARLDHI